MSNEVFETIMKCSFAVIMSIAAVFVVIAAYYCIKDLIKELNP